MNRFGTAICDWDGRTKELAKAVSLTEVERVYLTVEDRHVLYRQDNVHEAIKDFMDVGLEVILDPWGVAGQFAGETVSHHHQHSFLHWLEFVETTKATGVMLDEPTKAEDYLEFLMMQTRKFAPSKQLHLAIQPEKLQNLSRLCGKQNFDELSISTYLFGNEFYFTPDIIETRVNEMLKFAPLESSLWLQTWGIPTGREQIVDLLFLLFGSKRYSAMINIWAWDAFRTVSSKRSDNPDLVWKYILKNIQEKE